MFNRPRPSWGAGLRLLALAVLLAVGKAGSELLMWRFIQRYAVR